MPSNLSDRPQLPEARADDGVNMVGECQRFIEKYSEQANFSRRMNIGFIEVQLGACDQSSPPRTAEPDKLSFCGI